MSDLGAHIRSAWHRAGWGGVAAIAAVAVAGVVLASSIAPAAGILFAGVPDSDQTADLDARAGQFADSQDTYAARAVGRSPFWTPAPPPPLPDPTPPRAEREEPRETPPPAVYGGPALIALLGQTAWFEDDVILIAGGDTDEDSGVKLISTNPPWGATVLWKDVEFEVTLFERTTGDFLSPQEDPESADSGDAAAASLDETTAANDEDS